MDGESIRCKERRGGGKGRGRESKKERGREEADTQRQEACESSSRRKRKKEGGRRNQSERNSVAAARKDTHRERERGRERERRRYTERREGKQGDDDHLSPRSSFCCQGEHKASAALPLHRVVLLFLHLPADGQRNEGRAVALRGDAERWRRRGREEEREGWEGGRAGNTLHRHGEARIERLGRNMTGDDICLCMAVQQCVCVCVCVLGGGWIREGGVCRSMSAVNTSSFPSGGEDLSFSLTTPSLLSGNEIG